MPSLRITRTETSRESIRSTSVVRFSCTIRSSAEEARAVVSGFWMSRRELA